MPDDFKGPVTPSGTQPLGDRSRVLIAIPPEAREGFEQMAALSPKVRNALLKALAKAKPSVSAAGLASSLGRITGLDRQALDEILGVLLSLYLFIDWRGHQIERVASDLAFETARLGFISSDSPRELEDFERFLRDSLSLHDVIGITAQAEISLVDYENTYGSARISTDFKPLFAGPDRERPRAGLIVHTLRISVHESDRHYYFALDRRDVRELKETLDRALANETAVVDFAENAGISVVRR